MQDNYSKHSLLSICNLTPCMQIENVHFFYWDVLTHLPLDKMAAISHMTHSNAFSWMKTFCILIKISLKFVPNGPIDNKQLPELMLNQFTDVYMRR